jgi:hypothetical protein
MAILQALLSRWEGLYTMGVGTFGRMCIRGRCCATAPPLNEQIDGLLGVAGRANDEGVGFEILSSCHLDDRICVDEHEGGKIMNSSHERNEQAAPCNY